MRKNETFSNIEFTALIHTLQGGSSSAALSEDDIRTKPYVKDFKFSGGKAVYTLNPNKYGCPIENLADFKMTLGFILEELYVTDYEIRRLDVAINTTTPFDQLYKINSYLKELYAEYIGSSNRYHTNGDDLKKRSLKVTSRSYELEIYNKELESKGQDPAKTRIEFRFRRIRNNQTVDQVIQEICSVLDRLPEYIIQLNSRKIEQFYAQYQKEQQPDYEGRVTNLPAFVAKYADFIYNRDILNGLHNRCHKGKTKNWLYRYRASGKTLTLYTKGDLTAYTKQLKTTLNQYVKGTATPSLLYPENKGGEAA